MPGNYHPTATPPPPTASPVPASMYYPSGASAGYTPAPTPTAGTGTMGTHYPVGTYPSGTAVGYTGPAAVTGPAAPARTYPVGTQQSLAETLPPMAGTDPNDPTSFYYPLWAQNIGKPQAAAPRPTSAGGAGYNVPRGVDAVWYRQFMDEHDGATPEEVYKRDGDYALDHALADKAWGDQFMRTYGRPPSIYDWKASYGQRQRSYYGD